MKTFTKNLVVALLFAGAYAADAVKRQDDGSATTAAPDASSTDGLINTGGGSISGQVSIDSGNGDDEGNTTFSTSYDSSVTTSAPDSSSTDGLINTGGGSISGQVSIDSGNGNNVGNVDATSTSNGGAMGMVPLPTMMPMIAGGVLAAAAVDLAAFL